MINVLDTLARFRRDQRGSILPLWAFAAIPILALVGATLDYGAALSDKAKLRTAADAAALAAINKAKEVIAAGGSSESAIHKAKSAAAAVFKANAGKLASAAVPTPTVTMPDIAGLTISATVTYATSAHTQLTTLTGVSGFPIGGSAGASLTIPAYQNYHVVIDISQSMGIAATPADMAALYSRSAGLKLVNGGCVFACHNKAPGDPHSMEEVAHDPKFGTPIPIRLDAALSGVQSMVQIGRSSQASDGNKIRIALYTMSGYAASGTTTANMPSAPSGSANMLNTITGLTNNWSHLTTLASSPASTPAASANPSIELGANNGDVGYGDSLMTESLRYFHSSVLAGTHNGNGATAATAQTFVFIITDGVNDYTKGSCTWTHCTSAFDTSVCTLLKTKATVGVIYTTYDQIYAQNDKTKGLDERYTAMVKPIASQIAPALQDCASSPSLYYEAVDGPAIVAGINHLMQKTSRVARLTK